MESLQLLALQDSAKNKGGFLLTKRLSSPVHFSLVKTVLLSDLSSYFQKKGALSHKLWKLHFCTIAPPCVSHF